jgi:hypothetical protein
LGRPKIWASQFRRELPRLVGYPFRRSRITQTDKITTVLAIPGDFDSPTETTVGENIYTDPVTHKKVLRSTGRVVFGADGTLDFRAGQQPFLAAFVNGDMSVFDAVCAALG